MLNKNHFIYACVGIMVACGQAQLSSESSSSASKKKVSSKGDSDANSSSPVKILKSEKSLETNVIAGSSGPSASLSFASPELSLHQGESKEITVSVKGSKPNGLVTIAAPEVPRLRFEILNAQGAPLTGPLTLDAEAKGQVKVRISSLFQTSTGLVVAPGEFNATMEVRGTEDAGAIAASLPVKVSNVAIYTMSGVTNVRDLPLRFEFPAGTIPIFANPSDRQVVGVMHFQGGSQARPFRHQAIDGDMPMGSGYCPLNSSTTTLIPQGGSVSTACLPCDANATADSTGTFYNHETENNTQSRTIVCKRKI